jgi:hypothetical protein
MIAQDSSDPTGIRAPARTKDDPNGTAGRARNRKGNAALALAVGGMGWDDIAASLGYPTGRTAKVAVERALERQLANTEDRAKMRRMAAVRLDRLLRSVWPKAINPEHPEHLAAVGKARDVLTDHRKLFGLDAPTEVTVHNPDAAEIEAFVARLVTPMPVVEYDIIAGEVEGSRIESTDEPLPAD